MQVLVEGTLTTVDLLDLTVVVDHDVVDGAPATRFGADLRAVMDGPSLAEGSAR